MKDPFEEFGSTLSSSTTTDIGRDWIEPLEGGAPDWPDEPGGFSDTGLDGVTQFPSLEGTEQEMEGAEQYDFPEQMPKSEGKPREALRRRMSPRAALYQMNLLGATEDLRDGRQYTERRANLAFRLMLAFGVAAVVALLVGVGLMWAGIIAPGSLTVVGSLFSGGTFEKFRRMYRDERNELREIRKNLRLYKKARLDLIVATQIADSEERDKAIRAILKKGGGPSASEADER